MILWGLVALVVWPGIRWWRDARRAARDGPWYEMGGRFDGPYLLATPDPGITGHITIGRAHPAQAEYFRCPIAGDLDPGEAFAIAGPCASTGPPRFGLSR